MTASLSKTPAIGLFFDRGATVNQFRASRVELFLFLSKVRCGPG